MNSGTETDMLGPFRLGRVHLGDCRKLMRQLPDESVPMIWTDPGAGTTGVACQRLGRRFLGFEEDPHWCEYANRRLGVSPSHEGLPMFE